ncbi:DUF4405 domain-containing protein [Geofilum sp. OHC36d9]|uniref:DUF4405 domain-containing protein n=1 Tax=Geofilum sp. OHC36d9 TaxID=3458413 RepID=UPI0040338CC5
MKTKEVDKSILNLVIDGVLLILLAAMSGIGGLIKFILVPGCVRNQMYSNHVKLSFMGLDRQDWGRIHLLIGIIFIVLMVVHIVLHWRMLGCLFRKWIDNKVWRVIIASFVAIVTVVLLLGFLLVHPKVVPLNGNHGRVSIRVNGDTPYSECSLSTVKPTDLLIQTPVF